MHKSICIRTSNVRSSMVIINGIVNGIHTPSTWLVICKYKKLSICSFVCPKMYDNTGDVLYIHVWLVYLHLITFCINIIQDVRKTFYPKYVCNFSSFNECKHRCSLINNCYKSKYHILIFKNIHQNINDTYILFGNQS